RCLTAVEDIPTEAMMAGIDWTWETFPEYLADVERLPKGLNYGMYIGHSALRMYAMGKRALEETASEDDLRAMAHAVGEAIRAGALGFSPSRAAPRAPEVLDAAGDPPPAPRRPPGRQPYRRLARDRRAGRGDGGARFRHLPD